MVVVISLPFEGFVPDFVQGSEDIGVEQFAADASIESLDECILHWLPGLDEGEGDLAILTPDDETVTDELRAVVDTDHLWEPTALLQLLQDADHAHGWQRCVRLDAEHLPIEVVNDVEHAERTTVPKAVVHEVQAPDLIGSRRLEELLFGARREPLFGPATDIESQRCVDPVHALVIAGTASESQPMISLPEADGRMPLDKFVQRIDDLFISAFTSFVAVRTVCDSSRPAALTNAHAMLFSHVRNQPPPLVRA